MGKPSNFARAEEIELFNEFLRAYRSATGRAPDSHGRYHEDVFPLDPKIRSLRSKETLSQKREAAGDSVPILSSSHTTDEQSL